MDDKELFKILKTQGEAVNFSIALYENKLDTENTKLAKRTAKKFITTFGKYCEEHDLEMTSGIREFPVIGNATYLAVSKKDSDVTLMALAVPHNFIEVTAPPS